jgi:SAM-dependent methyltransferase
MFDEAAESGTRQVDAQLAAGTYWRAAVLIEAVKSAVSPGDRILDYGCGAGRISLLMARAGFAVTGVEPSNALLRKANEQNCSGLRLRFHRVAPGRTDGLVPSCCDAILCSSLIEFVPDASDLLRQFHELLSPRGKLFISFANRLSLWRRYAEWRFGDVAPHFRLQRNIWLERDAWRVLSDAGFTKVASTKYFESPFDKYPLLSAMNRFACVGTLGLITAQRAD